MENKNMSQSPDASSRLVYSSESGGMCPQCNKPLKKCACGHDKAVSAGDGIVRVSRETKGRKGKGVTLITGLPLDAEPLKQLGKQLKAKCGCGGTVKNGIIEIQGDHRDLVVKELKQQGFTVKRAGG
ncbi:MAG: translation initiation factor Sui1 [Desulfobacterales bacterium]|nr:translation initiation factor Sui1 [Desulfobacterales bacterium]